MINPFKKKELTDDELLNMVIERFDLQVDMVDREAEEIMFKELSTIENFVDYLNGLMLQDVKRHFKALSPAEQVRSRGAYARALYLKSKILKSRQKVTETDIPKLSKRSDVAV